MNIFKKWYHEFSALVEQDIKSFFQESQTTDYHPFVTEVYQDLIEYVLRAGRIAASLAMATYKGISLKEIDSNIIRVGTSLEIYGFGVLLHDDVFDCDPVRIQKDAFHIIYEKKAKAINRLDKKSGRFGESMAIISGNILHNLALIALSSLQLSDYHIKLLTENITHGFIRLNESQIVDIVFESELPTVEQWYQMARKRASSHTYVCMAAGGIMANWERQQQVTLQKAAAHLGYIFDIRDDLLDTFGEKGTVFQPPRRDLKMKKKPLHFCFALEKADEASRKVLTNYTTQTDETTDSTVLDILRTYGLQPARRKLEDHAELACQSFRNSDLSPEAQIFFLQFVERSLEMIKDL